MSWPNQMWNKLSAPARALALLVGMAIALAPVVPLLAQQQPPAQQGQQQPAPPEAGGPQVDVGPLALPKKKEEPPPEKKPEVKNPPGMPEYSLRVDVPLVTVPVLVTTKEGQFIPGLKKENFRVLEDGVPQRVATMSQSQDAPVTAVMLVEFASTWYKFNYDALNASYSFANTLKPNDWIAVIAFDMKPHMLSDFTQDKSAIYGALHQMNVPGFAEINTWDALYDTLDRVEGVEGRKYIILIGTGLDTFSKVRYDQVLKKVKDAKNVTIFTVSTGRLLREWISDMSTVSRNMNLSVANLNYLQAENAMNTFARLTGGHGYYPRFEAEMPEIFRDIAECVRNQYMLSYKPSNARQDGTWRKLKVELVDENGQPLKVRNQKGKDVKYEIIARDGYNAKHEVE